MKAELPGWRSVLAVVAHPDDESFALGAVLSAFVERGATAAVLCFTHGEASTLHGVEGDLGILRTAELRAAALELGVAEVQARSHPDSALTSVDLAKLAADVRVTADRVAADGLLVFDPDGVTGHPDHQHATRAALAAADDRVLGVLGWTVPTTVATTLNDEFGAAFTGHGPGDIDLRVTVDRTAQLRAVACHPSQAVPGSVLWRRLELLGDSESLRWLSDSRRRPSTPSPGRTPDPTDDGRSP